ncbi:hypothetical protein [Amycolatopsis sp. NPDC049159]|uniref:hypothetical protein n=1 Tax=Amycolatopsis sp. NPDC049159 TaxID=3157210 RepID=UPI0033F69DC8
MVTAPVLALTVARPAWIGDLGVWIANLSMIVLVVTTAFVVLPRTGVAGELPRDRGRVRPRRVLGRPA